MIHYKEVTSGLGISCDVLMCDLSFLNLFLPVHAFYAHLSPQSPSSSISAHNLISSRHVLFR